MRLVSVGVAMMLLAASCASGFDEVVWEHRLDQALAPVDCSAAPDPEIPEGWYAGPLFDTHLHMPHIPDSRPGQEPGERDLEGFNDLPFRDWTMEPRQADPIRDQQPIAGKNTSVSAIACLLRTDGTNGAFAFFPVFTSIPDQLLELARRTMEEHDDLFVPFIMSPGPDDEDPTVAAPVLAEWVSAYPGLFRGYGEIGLYEIPGVRPVGVPPAADLFTEIYPVVREHGLMVYFHPGDGQTEAFERVLAANPDIIFIVHGDQIQGDIGQLMAEYPNIYYTVDALYGDQYLLRPEENVESFLAATEDFEWMLGKDWDDWRDLIEMYPDRFMWGTDRGGTAAWTFDLDVGLRLVEYARAFIGGLDPEVQERFAYLNARRLAGT